MHSKIAGTRYVLAVKNLSTSVEFYKAKLGFKTIFDGDGWHFLSRDAMTVMLGECPDDVAASETGCHSYFAYADVNAIEEIYKEYMSKGIVLSKIEDKPWGQREFSVKTIDGHRIMFGEELHKVLQ
jgi:catechol 2,3-dioxygenase-like lactoylglutathione lyase family enzyme